MKKKYRFTVEVVEDNFGLTNTSIDADEDTVPAEVVREAIVSLYENVIMEDR